MSWIKSASKFLDELDNEAGQVAKESNTSGGVLGRAKLEVVKTLAIVEDQGIFEESDEESDKASSGANPDLATMAPLPPPPEAAVRFKPTLSSAAKPAPVAAAEAPRVQPEPELEPSTAADAAAPVKPGKPSTAQAAAPAAAGSAPLDTALKQELETQSSEVAQLRVSCRERDEALQSYRAEFDAAVAGYEANLDEFDRERKELVRSLASDRSAQSSCAALPNPSCGVAASPQRKSNDELRGKVLSMERMLSAASATKSSFESEFGSALEAKNAELKESAMTVQVCGNGSPASCPCKS